MREIKFSVVTDHWIDNFFAKIKFDTCWIWIAAKGSNGYGVFKIRKGKMDRVHRLSYFIFNGEFNNKLQVLHTCDNRACVNPDHLFLGSHMDNMRDMVSKKRHVVGERVGTSKIKDKDVLKIVKLYKKNKLRLIDIAKMYNVSHHCIGKIVNNQLWRHIERE